MQAGNSRTSTRTPGAPARPSGAPTRSSGASTLETPDIASATDSYARRFEGAVGRFFLDQQTGILLDLLSRSELSRSEGRSVLDIGGGHAQVAVPLVQAGFSCTILASPGASADRLAQALDPDAYALVRGSLLDLPFADRTFDHVVALRMLPHLRGWRRLLEEMCRVARRSVIVDYPDRHSVNRFSGSLFWAKKAAEGSTRPYRLFRRNEIEEAVGGCGFVARDFVPQFLAPMVLYRMARSRRFAAGLEAAFRGLGWTDRFGSPVVVRAVAAAADDAVPAPVDEGWTGTADPR